MSLIYYQTVSLLTNPLFSILIVIVFLGYIIFRQLRPRKLSLRGLVLFPVLILLFSIHALSSFHPTTTKIIEIVITTVVSVILGLLACRELKVYKSDSGKAMVKGSWTYFLWWVAAFIIKSVLSVLFGETKFSTVSQIEILIPVFLLIITRNGYLYWKAQKLGLKLH